MPTLVNYGGEDQFFGGGSLCTSSIDLYSMGSSMDIYYPPHKRARICGPYAVSSYEYEGEHPSSIGELPDECLFEIFRRLPSGRERSACACVSKHWLFLLSSMRRNEISGGAEKSAKEDEEMKTSSSVDVEMVSSDVSGGLEGDGYLTRCLEGKKATDVRLAAVAVGTNGRGGLGKLSIRGTSSTRGVTNIGISAIARGCPSLRALSLWNLSSIGDDGLVEIAKECRLLKKLDLSQCPFVSNKGLIAIAENCRDLISLNIESCPKIGNEGLEAIGRCCPRLQSISIKDCPLVGDHGVASLVSSASSVLSKIKLQGLNITDFSLAVIGHFGLAVTTFSGAVSSLEYLQVEELDRISMRGVIGVISNCEMKLKSLSIAKCMGIKDLLEGSLMLSSCTSLRSLSIRNCPGFGSASLAMVGKLCPHLEHIDLISLCGLTDAGLSPLLENSEAGLVKVNLSNCLNITDEAVSTLVRLHGGTLELLNLDGCRKVSDASLVAIADNCLLLNDLDMSKCSITDSGVSVLSLAGHLNLQVLSLAGCSMVSNKSVPFLKKLAGSLIGLNLQHCRSISSGMVEQLAESLWRCDILS
ncbi:hypothetical protein EUGRSUZ_C01334 [Eucalyptus grandis]|uniref:Uncharacterized protein n=2 Tax=Eucalyptus grandis TaxID=71139 RepID=A0ACC3LCZ4_EUCGR|nr:hypothetical protein EUGRSUZ_C01334 [Eucalyptus grandis]